MVSKRDNEEDTSKRDENERDGREKGEDGRWILIVELVKKTIKRRC